MLGERGGNTPPVASFRETDVSKAAEQAYDYIRTAILAGSLAPGSPLREENLAEASGVSRTPVREALRRLEVEQLVCRTDSKRCFVSDWSLDDIEEGFTLRTMLETHAVRRAAPRIDAAQLAQLEHTNDEIISAIRRDIPDANAFANLNRQFHAIIVEAAQSERLARLLTRLVAHPVVLRTATSYNRSQLEHSVQEHSELIRALGRRDVAWAESIMASHLRRAFHAYREAFQAYISETRKAD